MFTIRAILQWIEMLLNISMQKFSKLFIIIFQYKGFQAVPVSKALLFLPEKTGLVQKNKRSFFPKLDHTVVMGEEKQCYA